MGERCGAVDFEKKIVPGSFRRALCYLVDHEPDFSGLRGRYKNDPPDV